MIKVAYPATIPGPVGELQIVIDFPVSHVAPSGIAVIAHPHPQMGGTLHNKVVHILAKTLAQRGYIAVRFNFRGVGQSAGEYDYGGGEVDDYLAVLVWAAAFFERTRLWVAGFSFGSFIAASVLSRLPSGIDLQGTWLIAPPVARMHFDALPPLPTSTYVVQGTLDEVVDPSNTYAWCAMRAEQVNLLKLENAGHFFHQRLSDLQQLLLPTLSAVKPTSN